MRKAGGLVAVAVALAVMVAWTTPVSGQAPAPSASLAEELVAAQEAHLWRVAGWGGANLLVGLGLHGAADRRGQPGWYGFGIQAAAWGAINLGIVGWAFAAGLDPAASTVAGALAAEDAYGNILLLNLGLNVGYMAVGATLAIAAAHGLAHGQAVRGHGIGLMAQGLGLFALDGIAYAASRARMDRLQGLVEGVDVGLGPGGGVQVTLVSLGW